jgi:hypothetical protein
MLVLVTNRRGLTGKPLGRRLGGTVTRSRRARGRTQLAGRTTRPQAARARQRARPGPVGIRVHYSSLRLRRRSQCCHAGIALAWPPSPGPARRGTVTVPVMPVN